MGNEQEAITALFTSMERVRRAWGSLSPAAGITKSDFFTMMCIGNGGKAHDVDCKGTEKHRLRTDGQIPLTLIATTMRQTLPTISQRMNTLEQRGLVERSASAGDKRVTLISLSKEGVRVLKNTHDQMTKVFKATLISYGAENIVQFTSLANRFADELTAQAQNHQPKEGE